jgi:hypothetical protein
MVHKGSLRVSPRFSSRSTPKGSIPGYLGGGPSFELGWKWDCGALLEIMGLEIGDCNVRGGEWQ